MGAPVRAGGVEFPVLHGLTLEQFAGITAALAEEFPLDAVLANEEIDAPAWRLASPAWKAQIVEAAKGGGALFAAYREKLGEAEDCLRRRITPLDEDMGAWLGFLGAWSAHPAPFEILAGFGLRMNDVSRLQRGWSRQVENDASLREKMAKVAGKRPGAPSAVSAESATLKPFPWSTKREPPTASAPPTGAEASVEVGGLAVDQYAALAAEIAVFPAEVKRVLAKHGVPRSAFPDLEQRWKERLAKDPDLHRDWQRLYAHHQGRLRVAAKDSTARERLLVSISSAVAAPARSPEVAPAPASKIGGTSLSLDLPRGPALPFVEPGVDRIEMVNARQPPTPASSKLGNTSLLVDVPRGPALPFARGAALDLERPPAEQGSLEPRETPRKGTSPAVPPSKDLSETSLALNVPRGPVIPFARPAVATPATPPPIAPSASTQAVALTLEQHASLCVELALAPEHTAETLARYRLAPEAKALADQHFRVRMDQDPETRSAWDRAYKTYHAWVTTSRGPSR